MYSMYKVIEKVLLQSFILLPMIITAVPANSAKSVKNITW